MGLYLVNVCELFKTSKIKPSIYSYNQLDIYRSFKTRPAEKTSSYETKLSSQVYFRGNQTNSYEKRCNSSHLEIVAKVKSEMAYRLPRMFYLCILHILHIYVYVWLSTRLDTFSLKRTWVVNWTMRDIPGWQGLRCVFIRACLCFSIFHSLFDVERRRKIQVPRNRSRQQCSLHYEAKLFIV